MRTLALLFLLASAAAADVVYLKSGGKIEGKVTAKGDTYVVETDLGTITLKKSDVDKIEKKDWTPKGGAKMPDKRRSSLPESYSHPFYAFKVYLPAKWQRGQTSGKAACSFYGPKDVAYIPRLDLIIDRNNVELGEYVAKYKDLYKKTYPDVTFVLEEATAIQGKTAYQFSAVFKDGEIPYQTLWTFIDHDGRKAILSYGCTHAWFDKYYSPVNAAMRSFKFYAEPAATQPQKEEFLKLYNAGQELYRRQEYKQAIEKFRQAAALVPEYAEIHGLVGQAAMRLRNFVDAEAAYKKALEVDANDPGSHYNLGVCLLQQTKYDAAVAVLEKAVELSPDHEPALTNLGVAHLGKGSADKARKVLEQAVEADPESAPAHYNLGLACEQLGDKKAAERQFKDTLQIDPAHAGAKEGLARLKK